jgi:hypothetical protein
MSASTEHAADITAPLPPDERRRIADALGLTGGAA